MQPKTMTRPSAAASPEKPIATVTIEPIGRRTKTPREYVLKLGLDLVGIEPRHRDKSSVMAIARSAFAAFAPAGDALLIAQS